MSFMGCVKNLISSPHRKSIGRMECWKNIKKILATGNRETGTKLLAVWICINISITIVSNLTLTHLVKSPFFTHLLFFAPDFHYSPAQVFVIFQCRFSSLSHTELWPLRAAFLPESDMVTKELYGTQFSSTLLEEALANDYLVWTKHIFCHYQVLEKDFIEPIRGGPKMV